MVSLTDAIVKKGEFMFKNSFYVPGQLLKQPVKRKPYSFKMYCPNCCRFTQVANTGLPCSVCGSESIVPAGGWKPDLRLVMGGKNDQQS